MNNGLLVLGQGNQCGSVGVWEASLFVRLPLAPPGSSLAPPWLRLAAPGSSWLLSAPFGSSCSPSSSCLCCASLGCAGRLAARALPLSRPEHKLLLHMRARAPNLMTQTLDDMGASWPQDFMIACRHMQVCVRRCVTWVASWPQDFMIACRHVQVCVCVCVCVCACTLPARTNETAESPEGHDPNSYQMGYPGGVVLMVIPWVPPRPHHGP